MCTHGVMLVRRMSRYSISQAYLRLLPEHGVRQMMCEWGTPNRGHPDPGASLALSIQQVLSQPGDKLPLQASISLNHVT